MYLWIATPHVTWIKGWKLKKHNMLDGNVTTCYKNTCRKFGRYIIISCMDKSEWLFLERTATALSKSLRVKNTPVCKLDQFLTKNQLIFLVVYNHVFLIQTTIHNIVYNSYTKHLPSAFSSWLNFWTLHKQSTYASILTV